MYCHRQATDLVGDDALVDGEVLAAQRVDGDVPAQHAHAALLQRLAVAPPPQHAGPLRALRLLRLAVHLHRLAHLRRAWAQWRPCMGTGRGGMIWHRYRYTTKTSSF